MTITKKVYSVYSGSDPVKWLVLMRYGLKKGEFLLLEGTFWGSKVGFKGFGYWVLGAGCWGLVCIYCGCAAVNTNLGQSSLGSGLACWRWRQYILEVQISQQLGILLGQPGLHKGFASAGGVNANNTNYPLTSQYPLFLPPTLVNLPSFFNLAKYSLEVSMLMPSLCPTSF